MLPLAVLLAIHLAPVSADAPNRQPQLAAGNGTVAMVFGSGESIWLALSRDNGRTFDPPSQVATLPKLLLGRHRGPRVVITSRAIVVSAIASEPGDLVVWRSADNGHTWSPPVVVNDRPKASREGLHAMAADSTGRIAAVWLDDRVGPKGKRLWGAYSSDGGATWSKNFQAYESPSGTICECCHPSLLAVGDEFLAMWRNALDGSRDLYVMALNGGRAEKQGTGTWKLEACPMDGGGLAMYRGHVVSAWRREKDIYLAETGKAEVRLGAGQDVALAANARGWYAVWSSVEGIVARVPGSDASVSVSPKGGFPAIVAAPDGGIVAAWEENGAIATTRL